MHILSSPNLRDIGHTVATSNIPFCFFVCGSKTMKIQTNPALEGLVPELQWQQSLK